jgi:hypothetical protein
MKKFQEHGTLRGWYLGVRPAITDSNVVHVWFDTESGRDKAGLID